MNPEEVSDKLANIVNKAVQPLKDENEALKARIEELESKEPAIPDPEEYRSMIADEIGKAMPCAEELRGEPGQDGASGIGIKGAFIDNQGQLTITMADGEVKHLGVVVGQDGADGQDGANGKDGADFSDCHMEFDGERSVTIASNGKTITKRLPIPMWRGYYRDGNKSQAGDIWTYNGTAYIALKDTNTAPNTRDADTWGVFARKGDPGRDMRSNTNDNPVNVGNGNGKAGNS